MTDGDGLKYYLMANSKYKLKRKFKKRHRLENNRMHLSLMFSCKNRRTDNDTV